MGQRVLRISGGRDDDGCELVVGEWASFGRVGGEVDIEVGNDQRLHRRLGEVGALEDGWALRNLGRWLHLQVVALDGSGQDSVAPGIERRIPWSGARVEVRLGDVDFGFTAVYGGSDRPKADWYADHLQGGEVTRPSFELDRCSGYYRALVALCEPRLRGGPDASPPTNAQIAATLNASGTEPRALSAKSVERRLDYCAQLLGFKGPTGPETGPGLERRDLRSRLAGLALSTGTIGEADLEVLDG